MGISFQNVDFSYDGYSKKQKKSNILKNIVVDFKENNEFCAIVGHTGSGKSTFTQMCNGLNLPTSGKIKIFNVCLDHKNDIPLKPIRKRVGLVFQFPEYQLFEDTVLKDVAFGPKNFGKKTDEAKSIAEKYLELVGIDKSLYDKTPFTLSGGQMRKAAIAGILACEPDILIFDEPTVGLDGKSKDDLMRLLKQMNEEFHKTIIIVTHNMDVVANYCKRVIVFNQGEIVYDNTPIELFNNLEILKKYSLDLPEASKLAMVLKEKGLIEFSNVPFKVETIYQLIEGAQHE